MVVAVINMQLGLAYPETIPWPPVKRPFNEYLIKGGQGCYVSR
jgi:hypothetical protein